MWKDGAGKRHGNDVDKETRCWPRWLYRCRPPKSLVQLQQSVLYSEHATLQHGQHPSVRGRPSKVIKQN